MTAYAVSRRDSMAPALLAALAAHVLVFCLFVFWLKPKPVLKMGSAVPINIVAEAPTPTAPPAEPAQEVQEAQAEIPVAQAEPTPPAPPAPAKPTPTPAKPAPSPKPTPTPAKAATAPGLKPAPSTFSLDALEATIRKAAQSSSSPSQARQGPPRPPRAPPAPPGPPAGPTSGEMADLKGLLGRLWNPCVVVGGENVKLKATFEVRSDGRLSGPVSLGGAERSADPVIFASARQMIDAIHQVEPFPESFRGQRITVNFDAHNFCAG